MGKHWRFNFDNVLKINLLRMSNDEHTSDNTESFLSTSQKHVIGLDTG